MWLGGKRQEATSPSSMQVGAIPSIKMALDKGAKSVVLMSFCLRGDTAGSEVQHFSLFAFSTHMGILWNSLSLSLSWYLCSRSLLIVCCCHERQSSEMKPPIFLSVPNPSWPSEMRPYGKTRWQAQHKGHKTWKSTPWQWQFVSSLHFQTHTTYYNVYNCIILHTITTNTRNTLSGPSRTLFPARNRLYTTANFGKPVY